MKNLVYPGYLAATLTFAVLAYMEWQIPGLVSANFPLYLPLLVALALGFWSLGVPTEAYSLSKTHIAIALLTGIVLAVIVFRAGELFGVWRLFLAASVLPLPYLLLKGVANDTD